MLIDFKVTEIANEVEAITRIYLSNKLNRILLTTKGRQRKGGGGGRIWIERWLKKVEKGGGLLEGAEKGLRDRS